MTPDTIRHSLARLETTFDTFAAFAATDAISARTLNVNPSRAFLEIDDRLGSQSRSGTVADKHAGTWTLEAELKLADPPELHAFLVAAFASYTDAGSVLTYRFQRGALPSLQLGNFVPTSFLEIANGAWVRQLSIEGAGQALTTIKASGGFASYASLKGAPTVSGAHSSGDTTIQLTAGHAKKIISALTASRVLCDFGATKNNGGAGYTVTAVDYATNIITISPGLAVADALDGGETVRPFALTPVYVGSPVPNIASSLSVDAVPLDFLKFLFQLDTGVTALDADASRDRPRALAIEQRRRVSGQLSAYLVDNNALIQAQAARSTPVSLSCRFGPNLVNSRFTIAVPKALLELQSFTATKGVKIIQASFTGDRNAASDDEATAYLDSSSPSDVTAPVLADLSPASSATSVSVNTTIALTVRDTDSGPDLDTLSITFRGKAAVLAGVIQPLFAGAGSSIQLVGSDIDIVLVPVEEIAYGAAVPVHVECRDNANNLLDTSYTFTTVAVLDADTYGHAYDSKDVAGAAWPAFAGGNALAAVGANAAFVSTSGLNATGLGGNRVDKAIQTSIGTNGYTTGANYVATFPADTPFTLRVLYKTGALDAANSRVLARFYFSSTKYLYIFRSSNSANLSFMMSDNADGSSLTRTFIPVVGEWHFIEYSYNPTGGAGGNGRCLLRVDGIETQFTDDDIVLTADGANARVSMLGTESGASSSNEEFVFCGIAFDIATFTHRRHINQARALGLEKVQLMMLGDSITVGQGSTDGDGIRSLMYTAFQSTPLADARALTWIGPYDDGNIDHWASSGKAIDFFRTNITTVMGPTNSHHPRIVTLMVGTNDCRNNGAVYNTVTTPNEWQALVNDVYTREPRAIVIACSVIDANGDAPTQVNIEDFNSQLPAKIAAQKALGQRVVFCDVNNLANLGPSDYTDQYHPNDAGYAKIAPVITAAIRQAYAEAII